MKKINISYNRNNDADSIELVQSWMEQKLSMSIVITEYRVIYVSSIYRSDVPIHIDDDNTQEFVFSILNYCKEGYANTIHCSSAFEHTTYKEELIKYVLKTLNTPLIKAVNNTYVAFMQYGKVYFNINDSDFECIQDIINNQNARQIA